MAEPRLSTPKIVVGFGGYGDSAEQALPLLRTVVSLSAGDGPRVMDVPTAAVEDETRIEVFRGLFAGLASSPCSDSFPGRPPGSVTSPSNWSCQVRRRGRRMWRLSGELVIRVA